LRRGLGNSDPSGQGETYAAADQPFDTLILILQPESRMRSGPAMKKDMDN
jgi:hypothetical protein